MKLRNLSAGSRDISLASGDILMLDNMLTLMGVSHLSKPEKFWWNGRTL